MYSTDELERMQLALLEKQKEKKVFITVREAMLLLGATSTSHAFYKLQTLVEHGMAEKIGDHYHIKEIGND